MKVPPIIPIQKFENAEFPIKVQTIKYLIAEHDHFVMPHTNNYFEMIWMVNGKARLYVDMQEYAVDNNNVICLKPNQAHQFQPDADADGFVFSFTDSFFNIGENEFDWTCQSILLQLFSDCPLIGIQEEMEADMKEIVLKMVKEFEHQLPFRMQLLKRYFRIFLIYVGRQLESNPPGTAQTSETKLVKRFIEILDKNFREKKMVAEYAMQLSVTPNYLNRIIKKNTGYSAGHYIRQRVVLEAKRLARYSDSGMKEIAYNLGFADSSHFSRYFKAVSGINFTEFKKIE